MIYRSLTQSKGRASISTRFLSKRRLALITLLCLTFLSGCSQDEPVKVGFIGGLSGKVSDLGGPARNGMLLAIEEANRAGGIGGQDIITIIKDDQQDKKRAVSAVHELISEQVDVIIGPVTSAMAVEVADIATQAQTLMMGVTVTTNALTGKDDFFIRGLAPTAVHAAEVAQYLRTQVGLENFSVAYDMRNQAYSESWVGDFRRRFEELGGKMINAVSFTSGDQKDLIAVANGVLSGDPEIVLFVTNAVDAALLAKLIRASDPEVLLGTSEWAGTERLIELGGKFIEGAYVPQYLDRESSDPEFVAFKTAFKTRFNQEPGFPGLIAYNTTKAVLSKLKENQSGSELKAAILNQGSFGAVQGPLLFEEVGDAQSKTYITKVVDGRFVVQDR